MLAASSMFRAAVLTVHEGKLLSRDALFMVRKPESIVTPRLVVCLIVFSVSLGGILIMTST